MRSLIAFMMLAGPLAAQSGSAASLSKGDVKYVTKSAQGFTSELNSARWHRSAQMTNASRTLASRW